MKRWMDKGTLTLLVCLAMGCGSGAPTKKADTQSQTLGITFDSPEGWETRKDPNQMFAVTYGPPQANFVPNINIVKQSFNGSLDSYVKWNLDALPKAFKEFRLISQDDFKTAQGLQGARLITEAEHYGRMFRQTYYIFGKGDIKFVVTCTTLADGGDKLDQVFESSMKTVRIEGE